MAIDPIVLGARQVLKRLRLKVSGALVPYDPDDDSFNLTLAGGEAETPFAPALSADGAIVLAWSTGGTNNHSPTLAFIKGTNGTFLGVDASGVLGWYTTAGGGGSFVPLGGGTMTGLLTLSGAPSSALHAATKAYADLRLALAGGTLTGFITLHADPSSAMHAASKQYVDTHLLKSGGTMTGKITLDAVPTAALHAATKSYVDAAVSGSSMWGGNGLLHATSTYYYGPSGTDGGNGENTIQCLVPMACTLSKLYVESATAPASGKSWTLTVRKNGVDTVVTAAIANAATTASDTTHSVAFAAGDKFTISGVPAGSPVAARLLWGLKVTP